MQIAVHSWQKTLLKCKTNNLLLLASLLLMTDSSTAAANSRAYEAAQAVI